MFSLESAAFAQHAVIPVRHTCEGENVAPPLTINGVPAGTKSLALIVDDPDAPDPRAPKTVWAHWVVYNLPPDTAAIREGGALPAGARVGANDWKQRNYMGPCPPVGEHRYFFKLYALDVVLPPLEVPTRVNLVTAMQEHVIASAELVGRYQKRH